MSQPFSQLTDNTQANFGSIRFAQINLNGNCTSTDSLLNSLTNHVDIVACQHPYWRKGFEQRHPSFDHIVPPSTADCPRATFWVTKCRADLRIEVQPSVLNDTSGDLLTLKVTQNRQLPFWIVNIYNEKPLNRESTDYTLQRLSLRLGNLPLDTIICGDMNAHHPYWNSKCSQPLRHHEIVDLIDTHNYTLMNEYDARTYHSFNATLQPSVLDLTRASPRMRHITEGWAIDHDSNPGSDHELIQFNVQHQVLRSQFANHPKSQPYVWKDVDWEDLESKVGVEVALVLFQSAIAKTGQIGLNGRQLLQKSSII